MNRVLYQLSYAAVLVSFQHLPKFSLVIIQDDILFVKQKYYFF
jgi:hypothetical protein